jgi:hypothetical protein
MPSALAIQGPSPLKLFRRKSVESRFDTQGAADTQPTPSDAYLTNLTKLIPAEALAAYALLKGIDNPATPEEPHLAPLFCCVLVIIVRLMAARTRGTKQPQIGMIGLSLLTFISWTYAEGDWLWTLQPSLLWQRIAKGAVVVLAFAAPAFVGDEK